MYQSEVNLVTCRIPESNNPRFPKSRLFWSNQLWIFKSEICKSFCDFFCRLNLRSTSLAENIKMSSSFFYDRCQRCRAIEQEQGDAHSVCARQRPANTGGKREPCCTRVCTALLGPGASDEAAVSCPAPVCSCVAGCVVLRSGRVCACAWSAARREDAFVFWLSSCYVASLAFLAKCRRTSWCCLSLWILRTFKTYFNSFQNYLPF